MSTKRLDAYREASGDEMPEPLLHFYRGCRACVRGRPAVRHLLEPGADTSKRQRLTRRYLGLALRHMRAADFSSPAADLSGTLQRAPA